MSSKSCKPKYFRFYCEKHVLYRLITEIRTRQPMNCKYCKKDRSECSRKFNEYLDQLERYQDDRNKRR